MHKDNEKNLENATVEITKTDSADSEKFTNAYGFEHWPNECCQDCY